MELVKAHLRYVFGAAAYQPSTRERVAGRRLLLGYSFIKVCRSDAGLNMILSTVSKMRKSNMMGVHLNVEPSE